MGSMWKTTGIMHGYSNGAKGTIWLFPSTAPLPGKRRLRDVELPCCLRKALLSRNRKKIRQYS